MKNFTKIPFNKPFLVGNEIKNIKKVIQSGKISGNGLFTQKCHNFFKQKYSFPYVLLTTSCTDALEMSAILLDIKKGDEVIVPSFTFVSTANAFVLRGANIVFADSCSHHPNVSLETIIPLVTKKTKAIVVVHYAGIACEIDKIKEFCDLNGIYLIEDAAQAIDGYFKERPIGSFGTFSTFSFHETKNIISGEGGLLVINDKSFVDRAEIIWEKGTNRSAFFRGEIDKYGWVDIGSSFLPSEIIAAYLYAQLENLDKIQRKRKALWNRYWENLQTLEKGKHIILPEIPSFSSNNAHIFYILCKSASERQKLIDHLKVNNIFATFHYQSLHLSKYYEHKHTNANKIENANMFSDTLLRLPLFYEMTKSQVDFVTDKINEFYV